MRAVNGDTKALEAHQRSLKSCRACAQMIGPVVTGEPVASGVLLIGQAPGAREGEFGRPFAWTAGKTLFKWFLQAGVEEQQFRNRVYMAAVCRCFPGKNPTGGDRVPSEQEIINCARWLDAELKLLAPELVIPVGKLAIAQWIRFNRLSEVVGHLHRVRRNGQALDVVPLPHPSGASTWHRTEPGKTLLQQALEIIRAHPAWRSILE